MSVGTTTAHDAGPLHVTGAARYTDDIPTPRGTLHLAFGLSTIAKGRITDIDLGPVRSADGVIDVLEARDLPHDNDVSPSNHDEPLLATGEIHYLGQPIFIVVAASHLAARKAARMAKIEYDEQTPLLTIEEAHAANSHFEDGPRIYTKGDADAQLQAATNRLSGSFEIGGQEHFYLEGHAALAVPQEGGDMVVHASSQHPTEIQHKVAEALGRPMNAVRVEVRRMGGGFGGKESQGNALCVACAVVAHKHGHPVKMRYDRDDDMIITGKRHEFRIDYDVGFDARGRITAVDFTQYARCGWAQDLSLPVADRAMLHADNAYNLDHARITSHRLKTNTQSNTAFRGFGGPQGIVGIERVMDHIAHQLGIDPLQVRRENFYASMSDKGAQTTPYGMEVTDSIIREMVDALEVSSDYQARRTAVAAWNDKNPVLKRGIALTPVKFGISFTLTHLNQAGALVHVYQDGSVHLNHGGTEMGQGLFTKVAQVAAESFGVPLSSVKITATDTGKVPNTSATAASSGSDLNGMAVLNACEEIKLRIGSSLSKGDVTFAGGNVHFDGKSLSFAEAASLAYQNRVSLSATGFYATPDVQWDRIKGHGRPFFYFAYGAAVTEVVIDTLTGENRILRADILHDCGKSLNPALDLGQIEGAYVQGAGWLTTEELVWDEKGRLTTHAPATYKIPVASDRPEVFNVSLWDGVNRAETVFKSKAVGEPPFMHGISAWLALSDAISSCGENYPDLDAPATAERVLMACQKLRA
ncbi:xanthine dehydrogenase molybdopterin binding subunit [Litoreibacter janthinus]|uniref:Xanthine dehydrogenase, molybdenum binding subunit apoprotein n=1 Tax=Litoreibacter janthinus TaxID=670154 RepID=A0A1I6GHB0_9RHOB|nr:xanthine dehydrogenase molybdopterin binding subunit [Litoreibacter janthinus]SFR41623.1 xanthine dehydrogenase, molybdenum binding subunit apoprotein [Litoreibacter janthinus]